MNIYVGNLSWGLKDQDLAILFAPFGEVTSAKIVTDKFTGRSKGFGFVEMPNDDQANAAISALNGTELDGRNIVEVFAKDDAAGLHGQHRVALYLECAISAVTRQHGYADLGKVFDKFHILVACQIPGGCLL